MVAVRRQPEAPREDFPDAVPDPIRSRLAGGVPPRSGGRRRIGADMPEYEGSAGYEGLEFRLTGADLDKLTNGSAKVRRETRARLQANGILRPDPNYDGSTFGLAREDQNILPFPGVERGGAKKRGARTPERSKLARLSAEFRSLSGQVSALQESNRAMARQLMEAENARPLPLAELPGEGRPPSIFEVKRREEAARRAAASEAPLSLDDPLSPLAEELPVAAPVPVRAAPVPAPRRAPRTDAEREDAGLPPRRPSVPAVVPVPVTVPTAKSEPVAPPRPSNMYYPLDFKKNPAGWVSGHKYCGWWLDDISSLLVQEQKEKDKPVPKTIKDMAVLTQHFNNPFSLNRTDAKKYLEKARSVRFYMQQHPLHKNSYYDDVLMQQQRLQIMDNFIARLENRLKRDSFKKAVNVIGVRTAT